MSSIVSRNPPPSGSTNQAKDFFWMSMRLGTSTDLSRRANVRRVRGASTEAKTATPRGGRSGAGEVRGTCRGHTGATSQDSTGEHGPPVRGARRSRTPPGPAPVCGGEGTVDGCDYRPSGPRIAVPSTAGKGSVLTARVRQRRPRASGAQGDGAGEPGTMACGVDTSAVVAPERALG